VNDSLIFAFSLEFIILCKRNESPPLLLLDKCKFYYYIGDRCLTLTTLRAIRSKST
jgi:hypothetical protein